MHVNYKVVSSIALATVVGFFAGMEVGGMGIDWESRVHGLKNMYSTGDAIAIASAGGFDANRASQDFGSFWKAWALLEDKYVPTTSTSTVGDREKLIGAVSGLASAYGDPYTMVIAGQQEEQFAEQVRGSFEGIGAVISETAEGLQVGVILDNSPAKNIGLLAGDYVRSINGKSTEGMKADVAVKLIRGPGGSVVELHILRPTANGPSKEFDFSITRGTVVIPTTARAATETIRDFVRTVKDKVNEVIASPGLQKASVAAAVTTKDDLQANDFYMFRLASFSGTSNSQVLDELNEFKKTGTHNLILDLRGNPGGLVDMAVEIASHFLPKGTPIVSQVEGRTQAKTTIVSKGYETFRGDVALKIAVLVDRNTASAAEILAAALRDNGRAVVIGEKTYGKGSVQQLVPIADKIDLKITVARWLTAKGESISQVGVVPDVVVDLSISRFKSTPDPVMAEAVARLLGEEKKQ